MRGATKVTSPRESSWGRSVGTLPAGFGKGEGRFGAETADVGFRNGKLHQQHWGVVLRT